MHWQRRYDFVERREVLELVLTEGEADALADLIPLGDTRIHPRWRELGEAIAAKPPPRPPGNGLSEIVGKWPGDETDEEIQEALDALS